MSRWFPDPARRQRCSKLQPFSLLTCLLALLVGTLLSAAASAGRKPAPCSATAQPQSGLQKRWLFVWRDMSDPKEVDRMIARFPRTQADGYNGVAFSYNVPSGKAAELRQAAKKYGLDLVAIVM